MSGGFITNAGLCIFMNIKNHSLRDYINVKGASYLPIIFFVPLQV